MNSSEKVNLEKSLAFKFGYSVFETLRTHNGKLIFLDQYLDRLEKSARELEIPLSSKEELALAVHKRLLPDTESRIRITATKDAGWFIEITALEIDESMYKGMSLVSVPDERTLPHLKTGNRIYNSLVLDHAKKNGFDEVIMYKNNLITECANYNIFIVSRGILMTPKQYVLPGITRSILMTLTEIKEEDIRLADIYTSDEIFITNSLKGIVPITKVDGTVFPIGPITQKLIDLYNEHCTHKSQ